MSPAENYTHLTIVVDRSGSMSAIREAAEKGLKGFIAEQRSLPGKLTISLYQFDHRIDRVPTKDIDKWDLDPRGTTALLDALGTAITDTGRDLARKRPERRPGKVIVYVVTDGFENASTEWTKAKVFAAIEEQRTKYSWEFLFSAADQDAIATGSDLGFRARDSFSFAGNARGIGQTYSVASAAVRGYRG